MYIECRDYLVSKLKEAGIKSKPFTNLKRLKTTQETHVGAVLSDKETFDRSGAKMIFNDQTGARHKRRKLFTRDLAFSVIIGDPDPLQTETIFEAFLKALDTGIYIDGNYTAITIGEAEWAEEEDSILKAKVAVNIEVKFSGGVYKDSDFKHLDDINIQSVIKEDTSHE